MFGDDLHQDPQEVAARHRVETRDRLVQDQQFGPLRNCKGERELCSLAARELAGALSGVEAQLFDPPVGLRAVPAGVEPGTETKMVANTHSDVGGCLLRDEADPSELGRVLGGTPTENLDRA